MGITEVKRVLFLKHLLADPELNQTEAAQKLGYKSAKTMGCRMMKDPWVKEQFDKEMRKRMAKLDLKADNVLQELMNIGFADIAEAFDDNGDLLPLKEMPEKIRKAIAGVEVTVLYTGEGESRKISGTVKKIRFWEKTKGLELLGKKLKLWTDRMEVLDGQGLAERLRRACERTGGK